MIRFYRSDLADVHLDAVDIRRLVRVLIWFRHGGNMKCAGGFQAGATAANNGSVIVERSVALDEPVIYVSVNYRYVNICPRTDINLHCRLGCRVRWHICTDVGSR